MKKLYYFLFITILAFVSFSCSYNAYVEPPVEVPTDPVSFVETVEPIFKEKSCTGCHPSVAQLDLLTGNAYESIMNGRVDLDEPESSLIYSKAEPNSGHPQVYTNQQAVYVLTWIQQGALDN